MRDLSFDDIGNWLGTEVLRTNAMNWRTKTTIISKLPISRLTEELHIVDSNAVD